MAPRSEQWRRVDYDQVQHQVYARGRTLATEVIQHWGDAVAGHAPARTSRVADVGAGSGRFSPVLAESLTAQVVAVEPSLRMLEQAALERPHPHVSYVVGRAEHLPIMDSAVEVVFLSMVAHHLRDLPLAASELARIATRESIVAFRSVFRGRMSDIPLFRYFPRALSIENARAPAVEDVVAAFAPHGFDVATLDSVVQETDPNLRAYHQRLNQRALSVFEFLTEDEIDHGLDKLAADAEASHDDGPIREPIDLLVLHRSNR